MTEPNSHSDLAPGSDVVVREAFPAEYPAWKILWDGYNAFYGRSGETALPEELSRLTWDRLHSAEFPMKLLVASQDQQLVGFVHLIMHRSTTAYGLSCYLQDLFVAPGARRRGIAERLITAAATEARAAGSHRLYWQTHESNEAARRLYDRLAEHRGFIVYAMQL